MLAGESLSQPLFNSARVFNSARTDSGSDALCLSTAHISRLPHNKPGLRYARGGNYASVHFGRRPGRVGGGGLRGQITDFSPASRRRMMVTLNSIDRSKIERPFFVTLTWHDSWPENYHDRTRQLDALVKRLEVAFGPFPVIWRVEWQDRKSGARKGDTAPHLHLLVFLSPDRIVGGYLPSKQLQYAAESRLRNRIAFAWNEIAAVGDHEHFEVTAHRKSCTRVETWKGASWYASKYMAKLESFVPGSAGIGRNWGVRRRDLLGIYFDHAVLTAGQAILARRVFRRYSGQQYRNHRGELQAASCFLLASTTERLLEWLRYYADPPDTGRPEPPRARMSTEATPDRWHVGSSHSEPSTTAGRG